MVTAGKEVIEIAEKMRQEQKAEYDALRKANALDSKLDDKLTKADDANRIIQRALEVRRQEKNFILRGEKQYVDRVAMGVGDIVNLAKDMKSRFVQAKNQEQADEMVAAAQDYKAAASNSLMMLIRCRNSDTPKGQARPALSLRTWQF